jgi:hypothetical protein
MRVISSPIATAPVQPVRAPDSAENRLQREQSATVHRARSSDTAPVKANMGTASSGEPAMLWGDQGVIDAGITTQKVFHAVSGAPAEASLTEANRAYTKTDSLKFREIPFSLRVI